MHVVSGYCHEPMGVKGCGCLNEEDPKGSGTGMLGAELVELSGEI